MPLGPGLGVSGRISAARFTLVDAPEVRAFAGTCQYLLCHSVHLLWCLCGYDCTFLFFTALCQALLGKRALLLS